MPSTLSLAALAATGLLLVGGGAACASPAEVAVTPAAQSTADTAPAPGAGAAVDRAAAERTAVERAGGGQVVEVEFDRSDDGRNDDRDDDSRSDGRDHWEVEVRTADAGHDVDVDAATGEVLDHDIDRNDRTDDDRDDS
ncbi:PepSY domain-containing protein [Pseudonocardia alni]|uniref:PepSY domain-containing protein n=1 Tax=Pseudonocardia alni TaxID=33907 RepID=UPI00340E4404